MPGQVVGPIPYVDVQGEDQSIAVTHLEAAGILYEFAAQGVHSSQYALGEIAIQVPDPDVTTEIAVDEVVILTVSLGEQPVGLGGGLDFSFGFGFTNARVIP